MADASLPPLGRLKVRPLGLTDFPNEILHQIICELLPTRFRDSKYLASLCLVSKRFRDVVEPHLYHTLTLEVEVGSQGVVQTTSAGEGIVSPVIGYSELLRTLTEKPSLSNLVRVLSLGTNDHEVYNPHFVEHHLPILALFAMLQELHLDFPPLFSDLPFMPALKYLHLDFSSVYAYVPGNTSPLIQEKAKLKTVSRCLHIPTLQKLITQGLLYNPNTSRQLSFEYDHQQPSLTSELHLFQCNDASTVILRDMVLSIKCLKSLVIDHYWRFRRYGPKDPSLSGIDQALKPHQDSLEELMIAASCGATMETTVPIDSLLNFAALKRLAIPEHFLIPSNGQRNSLHDALPPSLCELQLQHYMKDVKVDHDLPRRLQLYTGLAENKYTSLPALRRLVCWYQQYTEALRCPDATLAPAIAEYLADRFRKVGVRFQWGKTSMFLATPFGMELDVPFWDGMVETHGWNKNQYFEHDGDHRWD